ncbi:RluA family pseudouridine synthase [Seonamhaeicola aphaedonensis]|uniref:RluA family pseudouridine synthase n=1 Tax=Seonamhaeicola aphaedonensis TaxID=1461338 RepID=A0A3D9HJD4_9FLAO|nr:RluA family pseudouridine synthase [Seonamhaeicola aphaedonensis]RED49568.1 RluA family pseudouridine synthase [Seonamhaeicola aphaedonensis]
MSNFENVLFHPLEHSKGVSLPKQFTFPFYYEPHELSVLATKDLQNYLENQANFNHNFGLNPVAEGLVIGKMFGVMVVKKTNGTIGYLAAFSGKLAERNNIKGFVPTVYDTLNPDGFYKIGEQELNELNRKIEALESSEDYQYAKKTLQSHLEVYQTELKSLKTTIKAKKKERKNLRESEQTKLSEVDYENFLEDLKNQSIHYHFRLKDLKASWSKRIAIAESNFKKIQNSIDTLKEKRRLQSASLQKRLHAQYAFLNALGETKDLLEIFKQTTIRIPPAGAGECAAPKLFQYAYENKLKPIAIAEFWWGASPKSEVRKHKQFYPSCRSKCEPILGHMMTGLNVEDNPILKANSYSEPLEIVYEDDYLLLVNKPPEFLSVPGKTIVDSVFTKMKEYLPESSGPLLVHRLDMSTSGLLLVAKNEKTHKNLQKQFIKRNVEKRYVALLDGEVEQKQGVINLPLRVDLDNRPQQLVCYKHGKPALTKYTVVGFENGKTRIQFYPITGRTHQLRVHASHQEGLNTPIIGDDIYGTKGERLYLHAEYIKFEHPVTQKVLELINKAPF